jgi:hypothetical protein
VDFRDFGLTPARYLGGVISEEMETMEKHPTHTRSHIHAHGCPLEAEIHPPADDAGGWLSLTAGEAEAVVFVRNSDEMDSLVSALENVCARYRAARVVAVTP